MKALLVFFFIFVITTSQVYSQWKKLPVGTDSDLKDLHFVTPEIGWVVGRGSTILKTTDGGKTWIAQQSNINENIYSVFFIDANHGWVGSSKGTILKTKNGGQNWNLCNSGTKNTVEALFFTDKNHGYAAVNQWSHSRAGWVLETLDGGDTWCESFHTNHYGLIDINFSDKQNGYAVGSNGFFIRTTDGGLNWTTQKSLSSYWLHTVFFSNSEFGIAAGGGYDRIFILRTLDGGKNWSSVNNSPHNGFLAGSYFINDQTGWVCGSGGLVLRTDNGGKNWVREYTDTKQHLVEMFFIESVGYVVGENGTILKCLCEPEKKTLKLMSPRGNEEWETGSIQQITWQSEGIPDVKIEYSYNNGASWNQISSCYPSTGIFNWTVPNIISNQAKIRIIDFNQEDLFDESKAVFKIVKED